MLCSTETLPSFYQIEKYTCNIYRMLTQSVVGPSALSPANQQRGKQLLSVDQCRRSGRYNATRWHSRRICITYAYDVDEFDDASSSVGGNGYKFVKFSSPAQTSLRDKLASFNRTFDVSLPSSDQGTTVVFEVKTLSNEWLEVVADLLTESFADSMGYINAYKKFLRNQIREYLSNHVLLLPKTVILVGILKTTGPEGDEHQTLVGTVEVSFDASTRSKHLTLNPPADMPYLCNMAVEPEHRRRGFGAMLLEAAEVAVLSTGYKSMYLHVRHADPPAVQLYRKYGYREEGEDWALVQLLRLDRRYLMKKFLGTTNE